MRRLRKRLNGGFFDSVGDAVSSGFNKIVYSAGDFVQQVKNQGELGKKDPWASVKNYANFTLDYAVKMPVNASASLYTATTGQKEELFKYGTQAGRDVASPSDVSSSIASNTAGGIIVEYIPWASSIHSIVYGIQKAWFPNSINALDTLKVNTPIAKTTASRINLENSTKEAGLDWKVLILIAGGAMALTYLENGNKKKTRAESRK